MRNIADKIQNYIDLENSQKTVSKAIDWGELIMGGKEWITVLPKRD